MEEARMRTVTTPRTGTFRRANLRCEDGRVTEQTLDRARAGDGDAFRALVDPHRRELLVHCYRMLGSLHDAEDALQETLAAAWSALDEFAGRASMRTWLYRIATNRCLNVLRTRRRHPRDQPLPPIAVPTPEPTRTGEPLWLDPYPDALLDGVPDDAPGPEARVSQREGVGLAFVTATQLLPPRQRAALVLRDVLGFRAAEVASMLQTSEDSITSALKRARATIAESRPASDDAPMPGSAVERQVVATFTTAFENGDVAAMLATLTDDAWLTMPPYPLGFQSPHLIGEFMTRVSFRNNRQFVTRPLRANGQPAMACYMIEPGAPTPTAHGVMVLTLAGERVAAITRFGAEVFELFGIADTLPD
jgi:RNA polymerase sigma-70 factor (ECF subfamily)